MRFINLTAHEINIVDGQKSIKNIPPSGFIARCTQSEKIITELDGIPVVKMAFGKVVGLPEREDGTYYIVSKLVATATPDRDDLLIPGSAVRDESNKIIGCRGLSVI